MREHPYVEIAAQVWAPLRAEGIAASYDLWGRLEADDVLSAADSFVSAGKGQGAPKPPRRPRGSSKIGRHRPRSRARRR